LTKAFELSGISINDLLLKENDIFYSGTNELLDKSAPEDYEHMLNLYRTFEDKTRLLMLLQQCLNEDKLNVMIGLENQLKSLEDFSLITAAYSSQGKALGTLAVLGPKRMNYDSALGIVYYTRKIVNDILTKNGF
jgi:heat-inducible transcriptional repressor